DVVGQVDRAPFGDLEGGPEAVDEIQAAEGGGHAAPGPVAGGPAAAPEVFGDGRMPRRRLQAGGLFLLGDFPERLEHRAALAALAARAIERGGAGVAQVEKA